MDTDALPPWKHECVTVAETPGGLSWCACGSVTFRNGTRIRVNRHRWEAGQRPSRFARFVADWTGRSITP